MALIDAINAGTHPATSAGAANDAAAGYSSYLCADVELLNAANAEALFGAGVALEDDMVIALPDSVSPNLDGNNRFDFSDITAITNVVIALFTNSSNEWTSADLSAAPDTVGPVISITGGYGNGDVLPAVNIDDSWTPPNATATDDVDGVVTVTTDSSGVDLSAAGNYFVGYEAEDAAGNVTTVILTLPVQAPADTTGPVITITGGFVDGDTLPAIDEGDAFTAPTATAFDNEEAQAVAVSIDSSAVNVSAAGNYSVVYTASDGSGNTTTVTLTQPVQAVVVPDTTGPVITITGGYSDGDTLPAIIVGDAFAPPSANGFDNEEAQAVTVDIDLTAIDINNAATYPIVYSAVDSSGNTSSAILYLPVTEPVGLAPLVLSNAGNTTISIVASRAGDIEITIINPDGSIAREPIVRSVSQGYNAAITLGGVVRSPQRIRVEPLE